jgi:UDP-N-acetylglucosamine 2-epimerase (non-hydrolysing)
MSHASQVRVAVVAGARPNFMKAAPVLRALKAYPRFQARLVHTGQHYDEQMSGAFFAELDLPKPDVFLGVGSGSQAEQTGRVMVEFERHLGAMPADLVVVIGDVNSTLGCSVVAAKAGIPVAHVEAGLRSFDRSMPEEINRIVTDSLSQILFTTSAYADEHLLSEGHPPETIHLVGNTMIDTLERHRAEVAGRAPLAALGVPDGDYLLVTLHRPANVDDPQNLRAILAALASAPLPIVFPMHPRTRAVADRADIAVDPSIVVIPPAGYLDFLRLQLHARLVLTDSGGIQEETTVLGVPCLTFRDNTERPVTISSGTNRLIGTDPRRILPEIEATLAIERHASRVPPLWDGHAAERLAAVLDEIC